MNATARWIGTVVATLVLMEAAQVARAESVLYLFTATDNDGRTLSGRFSYNVGQHASWWPGYPEEHTGPRGAEFSALDGWGLEYELDGYRNVILPDPVSTFFEAVIADSTPGLHTSSDILYLTVMNLDVTILMKLENTDGTAFDTHMYTPPSLDFDKFDGARHITINDATIRFSGRFDTFVLDPSGSAADLDPSVPVIPEPPTLALCGLAMPLMLIAVQRARRNRLTSPV